MSFPSLPYWALWKTGLATRDEFRRRYLSSVFIWNPIISLLICWCFTGGDDFLSDYWKALLVGSGVSHFCFAIIIAVRLLETKICEFANKPVPIHRTGWYFALSTTAMPLGVYVSWSFWRWFCSFFGSHWGPIVGGGYRTSVLLGTLISGLFFLFRSRAEAREQARLSELKMKQMENEHLKSQISALTAQMNPHLLFNALNTVASLVSTEPQKAESVILRLSDLYRGVLDSSRRTMHSLAAELEICRAYLWVENARFGDRLIADFDIDPSLPLENLNIPTMTIQPLVENAVRHGVSSRASGGRVRVSVTSDDETLRIRVEDDGVGLGKSSRKGSGSAIVNCRERLRLQYGGSAQLEVQNRKAGGTSALVVIPLQTGVNA